jgi:4-alpha-glucanotransferase
MNPFAQAKRSAGVLLHPSSLPSGTLADADRWLDFLAAGGFSVWQMLPLGVPINGLSPYQCDSAFAVNPALFPASGTHVPVGESFDRWYATERHWVDDYALFRVAKRLYDDACWVSWPRGLKQRDPAVLAALARSHEEAVAAVVREQFRLHAHWQSVRRAAAERGIALFGDMPLFVAFDSADVWAHRELFLLDEYGMPTYVAGVPPDYFSASGQRWGNPQYNWAALEAQGFRWWLDRVETHLEWFDLVRIDHFRGLVASWMIPAECETAVDGFWQPVPGEALLRSLAADRVNLPLVAEDLGIITPEVTALRRRFGLPGMAVLQFAFDAHADNPHKPENVTEDIVYYTGTHDNDTTLGWFRSLPEEARQTVMRTLGIGDAARVVDAMLETIWASRATLAVAPLQDLLHLGSEARMNTPGTVAGNWLWRFDWADLPAGLASDLHVKLQHARRTP